MQRLLTEPDERLGEENDEGSWLVEYDWSATTDIVMKALLP
jgi:hypothetical protein